MLTTDYLTFTFLIISFLATFVLTIIVFTKTAKGKLRTCFLNTLICLLICYVGLISQVLFTITFNINPIYFDYIAYIGVVFLPVFLYLTSQVFSKPNFKIKPYHKILFAIPFLSLIILWTNEKTHLFYTNYSILLNQTTYGGYFYIYSLYTYSLLLISLSTLLKYSFKQKNKFSVQSLLLLLAIAVPVLVNIVGMLGLAELSLYVTPISFTISILLVSLSIFKFNFLNINTIATNIIVNIISDCYLVVNLDNIIVDSNKAFFNIFNLSEKDVINHNIFDLSQLELSKDDLNLSLELVKAKKSKITIDKHFEKIDKYFSIDISPILKNDNYLGTLIFLRDVTEKEHDKLKIKANQDLLIEQERLASLGQMIGGIAHNLKTPIFSIAGGLEGLSDLIKEYDESIEDNTVTNADMHDIAKDMNEWISKLKEHISYMSEVITTVKGQAVTMSEEQNIVFPISELFQHVTILMQHELKEKLANLKVTNKIPDDITIDGNINSLVQVINNLISNSIEAYGETTKQKNIDLSTDYDEENDIINIAVKDYGPGLPESVQDKLFKEMITTKGKDGTGLGLFMSYSNIKAHFSGNLTFKTQENEGTTFYISIPRK